MTNEYSLNMPDKPDSLLKLFYEEDDWSWNGLAESLCEKYKRDDIETFLYCIKEELERLKSCVDCKHNNDDPEIPTECTGCHPSQGLHEMWEAKL
jgi:hypothetical protein